ncbi:hexosaminidase D-like [Anticarsia gemmatalis]|uniref:hexosaminidase D-like n=1 Tax=Anticarsia gemmatalis TaxID=129554 RepID=UPI003F757D9D
MYSEFRINHFYKFSGSMRLKFFSFIVFMFVVYLIIFCYLFKRTTVRNKYKVNLEHVIVHIDLKGAPPKLEYLESLLPTFQEYGVNGILMEYEDMFPYENKLVNLSSRNCYDREKLKRFLERAMIHEIRVIPLVQTFGHMEHVLKLEEFKHLREDLDYPDSICPSNIESIQLVHNMLAQVIDLHSSVSPLHYIHIGCDEVFSINKCEQCLAKNSRTPDIYLNHVNKIKDIVLNFSPYTTVLIWDDMLRKIKPKEWHNHDFSGFSSIEPVYWDYTPQVKVSHLNLFSYHSAFRNIWISSAYKGADGRQATLPKFKARFDNHHSWMIMILNYVFAGEVKVFNFKGIILTGWSRYSHLDPLCELLPASLPSLVLNLLLIRKFKAGLNYSDVFLDPDHFFNKYIAKDFYRYFRSSDHFSGLKEVDVTTEVWHFENNELFSLLKRYKVLIGNIDKAFTVEEELSSIEYYVESDNFNLNRAQDNINWCNEVLKKLQAWEEDISKKISRYYEKYVIEEYVGCKIYSTKKRVLKILNILNNYTPRVWPQRPFNSTRALT